MKDYVLVKKNFLGIDIKEIRYSFKVQETSKPTSFIKIIIHHTGKNKTIQQIINSHIKKNRYSSIGYHFMISNRGTIYYSRDLKYAGAHTFEYNKNSIGIALFGNFDETNPTMGQIDSLISLISKLEGEYNIKTVLGHNEAIYKLIKDKFWKVKLPNLNPIEINTKLSYDSFVKRVTEKILEFDAEKTTVDLIKKFKTCPGFNMYKYLRELKN